MIPVVVVAGPTAVGKSGLALEMAERFDAEIIGADSIQVFRGMDIGSAKPTRQERARVRHHLIDVANPDEGFSAGRYAQLATVAIEEIAAREKRILLVGGSGLYLRALLGGLASNIEADPAIRKRLSLKLAREGVEAFHGRLAEVDPEAAHRIHRNDSYRVIRALEFFELTGRPISEIQSGHAWGSTRFTPLWIGLTEERNILYDHIEKRCEKMVQDGLLEEVHGLVKAGYPLDLPSMRSLGYKQMGDVLRGERTADEALADMKKASRRYAKRQLTWFRSNADMAWFAPSAERAAILEHAGRAFAAGRASTPDL